MAGTLIAGPVVDALIAAGYVHSRAYQVSFAVGAGLTMIGLCIQAGLLFFLKKRP
jgi:hypothetical protein